MNINFRRLSQISFLIFNLYIGWRFYLFVQYLKSGGTGGYAPRPPSVEAYLPISALLGLKYWITTGVFSNIHPASIAILIAVILVSLAFKRSFCSWICPIGTFSEYLWKLGNRLRINLKPSRWVDAPLRSLKYIVLGYFVWVTMIMTSESIGMFLNSSFNKVADIKLLYFFLYVSLATMIFLVLMVIFSLFIRNFWCRYLCPYGALLGIISIISPLKIERNPATCIECHNCDKACPGYLKVSSSKRVYSPECTGCMDCIRSCKSPGTLKVKAGFTSKAVPTYVTAAVVICVFFLIIGIAQLTGHWQTHISLLEYLTHIINISNPVYSHPA